MYLVWFAIALLMLIVYYYIGFSIWLMVRKRLFSQDEVSVGGIKRYYPFISAGTVFVGIGSLYFGSYSITGGPHNFRCWLVPTIVIAIIEGVRRYRTLKMVASNKVHSIKE